MARLINIENFRGGLNLEEPTTLEDNQFEVLTNMFYTRDKRIQSRRGIKTFGPSLPSPNTNKPITSSFFFVNDITNDTHLVVLAGDSMYLYDEVGDSWTLAKSGLTEFESDGVTRTRWSFAVYLNLIYLCNGIDNYAEYDPATNTYVELGTQPKVRHLEYLNDSIFGGGADTAPNVAFFTDALPVDGRTLNANDITVGGDEQGRIRGFEAQQQSVIAFKDTQIYSVGASSALPTDTENGGYGDRAIKRVGNSLVYFNDRGFNTLQAKSGITGTQAIETVPLSDNVRKLAGNVINSSLRFTIGEYILPLTNYYGTFDTTGESIPETTLVYSSLTQGWSFYTFPAFNDYTQYINSDGNTQYLAASANTGQMFEIETGFNDLSLAIPCELRTKKWDLGDVTRWKSWQFVDIVGLKSQGDEIEVDILVDGIVVGGATIDNTFVNFDNTVLTIGGQPVGTQPIGGGSIGGNSTNASALPGEEVDLFQYKIRIPMYDSGSTLQVRMTSNSSNMVWTLDKLTLKTDTEALDLVPFDSFVG